jgi:hypothetical protein
VVDGVFVEAVEGKGEDSRYPMDRNVRKIRGNTINIFLLTQVEARRQKKYPTIVPRQIFSSN